METRVAKAVDKHTAFHTRVAVNVLKIVERELDSGQALENAEKQRIADIVNVSGSLREQNEVLCKMLREGDIDPQNPELIDHLRKTVMGRLSIDNPKYSTYKSRLNS